MVMDTCTSNDLQQNRMTKKGLRRLRMDQSSDEGFAVVSKNKTNLMKYYIKISFIICAALTSTLTYAQVVEESRTDSTNTSRTRERVARAAFRDVPESQLLGGVSVVDMTELIDKNYSLYSLDNMQAFVGGWTGATLWGMDDYLVLVDGVPRDVNNVLPTEIQQITFLKSASAVMLYGSRAAKGVVSITTKRGAEEPLKINVRANSGFYVSKRYPKFLGSAEYMTLYNEALVNDGLEPQYNDETIYLTASGANPYRYPDVDFYSSEFLKKAYNRSDVVAELSGGDEKSRFYTNIGYYRENDLFKFGEAKDNYIDRLNVRGNVDLKLTKSIGAFVNANATFYNARTPNVSGDAGSYWAAAATMRPNRMAPLIPIDMIDPNDLSSQELIQGGSNIIDGKYFLGGSSTDLTNIFADYYAGGNSKWTSRQFQFDAGLNFDMSRILEGLSFHTQYAVDYATTYVTSFDNTYAVYVPQWHNYNGEDVVTINSKLGNDKKSGVQNISGSSNRQTIAFNGYFNYVKSIDDKHNFLARLVATGFQQTFSQQYHRTGNANLGLQVDYNFDNKYFVDLGAAVVHSAKLAKGNRNGLSSSATLGWRLSEEGFLNSSSVVDDLVISASGSVLKTDIDITDEEGNEFYLYETNYTQAQGAWWGWRDGASERSTNSKRWANPDLGFINRKEVSLNVRTSLWDRLITADVSLFLNRMEGLVIQPATRYPSYFSTFYPEATFMPFENFNNHERRGMDFNVNVNKNIGQVGLSVGLSGIYYTSKATKLDELFVDEYRRRTGKPLDGVWGLQSLGLFRDQAEIDNSPRQAFGDTKPGDIKYADQNGDGVVDEKDEVYLGRGGWYGGPFATGVNLTARWKGFTLFALGTGNFGAYTMKNSSYFWVFGTRKYSEFVRDRWTPETAETATYPRLTTTNGANNFRNSDYWLIKTNWFNIARVQLTYDLPSQALENSFFKNVSIYVSGSDLLLLSKERELLETSVGGQPQARFYNLGVRAAF